MGKWIAWATIAIVFLISKLQWMGWIPDGSATHKAVFHESQYWRLLSSLLVHSDLRHLLSNSLLLFVFAYLLNGYFGWILFPLYIGLFSLVANAVTLWTYPAEIHLLGASGAVYLMSGCWLSLFFLIERRYTIANRLLRCAGFSLLVLGPTSFDPQISYRAHAIGLMLGLPLGTLYFFLKRDHFRSFETAVSIEDGDHSFQMDA